LQEVREFVNSILDSDPHLTQPQNEIIVNKLKEINMMMFDWGKIS